MIANKKAEINLRENVKYLIFLEYHGMGDVWVYMKVWGGGVATVWG